MLRPDRLTIVVGILFIGGGVFLLFKLASLKETVRSGKAEARRELHPPPRPSSDR